MRHQYLSTFLSGTAEIVIKAMSLTLSDFDIEFVLDGLVVYETNESLVTLSNIGFFNNTFVLIKQFDSLTDEYFEPLFQWILEHDFENAIPSDFKANTFRIIVSDENKMVSIDKRIIRQLEKKIKNDTHLKIDRLHPATEVWFYHRSEGYGFILLRITNDSHVAHRNKGQLRSELTNLMCVLASPQSDDVIIDPFAGYGTIVNQLVTFSHQKIIAFEKENNMLKVEKEVDVVIGDFFANELIAGSVNIIVTDPPWGVFDDTIDPQHFYHDMFAEFHRLLATNGEVILLFDRKLDLGSYLSSSEFETEETYDVLVSGKKATIYRLKRK